MTDIRVLKGDGKRAEDVTGELADRIEAMTAKLAKAVEALDRLARLGNGDRYGNSEGNVIARATLAEIKGENHE
jgi:hypothetical protein